MLKKTLPSFLIATLTAPILTACAHCPAAPQSQAPTKPQLESLNRTHDGGISLNRQDATELAEYILELERIVKK